MDSATPPSVWKRLDDLEEQVKRLGRRTFVSSGVIPTVFDHFVYPDGLVNSGYVSMAAEYDGTSGTQYLLYFGYDAFTGNPHYMTATKTRPDTGLKVDLIFPGWFVVGPYTGRITFGVQYIDPLSSANFVPLASVGIPAVGQRTGTYFSNIIGFTDPGVYQLRPVVVLNYNDWANSIIGGTSTTGLPVDINFGSTTYEGSIGMQVTEVVESTT